MMDQIALFLTALGALGQGVPLLWQQDTMLSMLQEKERSALSGSGFARWCLMAHQGCLHLMIAAISIMAALLYAVQELFFLHVLLFIYNGSWAGCKSSCTSSLWLRAFVQRSFTIARCGGMLAEEKLQNGLRRRIPFGSMFMPSFSLQLRTPWGFWLHTCRCASRSLKTKPGR
ncbi:unnamed protein product [Durusdinium trenchii]|uniref:Uncharacterized protein n=1 Tax=Durusdinium trenchii TaxID=1381693 RepID=A0ABP0M8S2_9DINO